MLHAYDVCALAQKAPDDLLQPTLSCRARDSGPRTSASGVRRAAKAPHFTGLVPDEVNKGCHMLLTCHAFYSMLWSKSFAGDAGKGSGRLAHSVSQPGGGCETFLSEKLIVGTLGPDWNLFSI